MLRTLVVTSLILALTSQVIAEPTKSDKRAAAWSVGSDLSLAAVGQARGLESANVNALYGRAKIVAKGSLQAKLPPLFAASGNKAVDDAAAMKYLLAEAASVVVPKLSKLGKDHASLYELAVKCRLVWLVYHPRDPVAKGLADAIAKAALTAGIPNEMWAPLVKQIMSGASEGAVVAASKATFAAIDAHLTKK